MCAQMQALKSGTNRNTPGTFFENGGQASPIWHLEESEMISLLDNTQQREDKLVEGSGIRGVVS